MANVNVILRKETKKDGTSPLAIRITKDRKSSYIYLEYSIKETDWDKTTQRVKKSHPNSKRLNNFLIKKLAEANDNTLESETKKSAVSAKSLAENIKPKTKSTLFPQADLYLEHLKQDGKFNRYSADKPRVKHLKEFLKNDIAFSDITLPMLERFKASLKSGDRKLSERSAVNHLVVVRSIFSQAIKENVCDAKYYPFGKDKIKIKFPDSKKVGLNKEDVANIEAATLSGGANHARNLWLLSFYFAGMRVSDVLRLKWSDFQDGRMYYTMGKNEKGGSLKVPEKVLQILKQYEGSKVEDSDLIFSELRGVDLDNRFEMERIIASRNGIIDKYLREDVAKAAKIKSPLTMHIARHTFGNISGDTIPIQMLQKLYRHSSITTTIGYQANFIHKDADEALEAVIGI
jgi:integrase/recombinase XerD